MTTELEDLVRRTLAERAPSSTPPGDWATLRARALRRTVVGRSSVLVGAAAVGSLAITSPWSPAPAGNSPATGSLPTNSAPETTTIPSSTPSIPTEAPTALPYVDLAPSVVDQALAFEREMSARYSTGRASRDIVAKALGTLMAAPSVTEPSAQPHVIWSSAGHTLDDAQGAQVLVAVEQTGGWVLGLWDERAPFLDEQGWVRSMSFGAMSSGPLESRIVGFAIPDGAYDNMNGDPLVVYAAPAEASSVVKVVTRADEAEALDVAVGAEIDLNTGHGFYGFSDPPTIRAYASDGTLLDEQTYG